MAASFEEEDIEEELGVAGVFTTSDESGRGWEGGSGGGGGIKRGGGLWRISNMVVEQGAVKSWEGKR